MSLRISNETALPQPQLLKPESTRCLYHKSHIMSYHSVTSDAEVERWVRNEFKHSFPDHITRFVIHVNQFQSSLEEQRPADISATATVIHL